MKTKNFQLSVDKGKKNKEKKLTLEGDLSLKNIHDIKETLQKEILNTNQVIIHIKNVDNMDIGIIQLLVAIRKEIKNLKINAEIPPHIENLMNIAGLGEILKTNIISN